MEQGSEKGHEARSAERREQALQLRMGGMSYYYIGQELGVSKSTAYLDVQKAIKEIQERYAEDALTVRTMEIKRLDIMMIGLWEKASSGDNVSIDRVIKIMDRKAKLLGLDAPVKSDITNRNINIEIDLPEDLK